MKIELTRFRVCDGAQAMVKEWLQFLNANASAVRETLEPEQMYVETIFSETVDGVDYLYWYSVQGEDGSSVEQSEHWLDENTCITGVLASTTASHPKTSHRAS